MKIDVKEVKILNEKLKEKINSYENNYLQYYNYLNHASMDWYDTNSKNFFQTIDEDKKDDINTLNEIVNISKIYDYLINNYEEIGNQIEYNPDSKEKIFTLLDDIISIISKIINNYNSIGIYSYAERSMLYNQKNTYMSMLEKMKNIKHIIRKNINKIEKTEHTVTENLSKLVIVPVKEKNVTPYK